MRTLRLLWTSTCFCCITVQWFYYFCVCTVTADKYAIHTLPNKSLRISRYAWKIRLIVIVITSALIVVRKMFIRFSICVLTNSSRQYRKNTIKPQPQIRIGKLIICYTLLDSSMVNHIVFLYNSFSTTSLVNEYPLSTQSTGIKHWTFHADVTKLF